MSLFVVDASVVLAWCFEDEGSALAVLVLELLRLGDRVLVPAHWPTEILNGLLMAERRKRIKPGQAALFWDELSRLPIETEATLTITEAKAALTISEKHDLTVYDAVYLEFASRRQLPLGTLDLDLRKAAQAESVALL